MAIKVLKLWLKPWLKKYRAFRGILPEQIHLSWVQDPSTTLTIVWRTANRNVPSLVEYRAVGESEWKVEVGYRRSSGTKGTLHEVTLVELSPATAYEYRVKGEKRTWSDVYMTRTAPADGPANFDVIYFADTGLSGRRDGLTKGAKPVVEAIARMNSLFTLAGGDYAYFKSDKRYSDLDSAIDAWFNQVMPLAARSPMMPTYGNHEALLDENCDAWMQRFATPDGFDNRRNYSFDIGDVHFVSIFAVHNFQGLSAAALKWIERDILAAKAAGQRWIIPFTHVSPFADGCNHPSNLELRAQLGPLFERLGVKVVLSSHDQAYERTYPLVDVPIANQPTTTAKTGYTEQDGVTWVKASPSGKVSDRNQGFSPFATTPAPAWTAHRENTMHVFTRLTFSEVGRLTVETFGVRVEGGPPVLIDSFDYCLSSAEVTLEQKTKPQYYSQNSSS